MQTLMWFNEYIASHKPDGHWTEEADWAVRACIAVYRKNGDLMMKQHVLSWANSLIAAEACSAQNGKAFFFALEETGDLRYREAIESAMECLGRTPGEEPLKAEGAYGELPFRMAYEMKLGGMEKVGMTAAAFRRAHEAHWDGRSGLFSRDLKKTAKYLLALADAISLCSDQLYEHWRALVDLYREALKGALRAETTDLAETEPMLLLAMLAGVGLGLIDPERYLPIARRGIAALRAAGEEKTAEMLEMEGGAL